jgi:hypothetical protein
VVTGVYAAARANGWVVGSDLVATRVRVTAGSLRGLLGDADVSGATAVLRRGSDAADRSGRPLFAGLSGQAWPSDPYGQLWRARDVLREHRGGSHIAARVVAGLDEVEMTALEAQTDAAQQRIVDAIGADLDRTVARLAVWSGALVAAGAFPPSVHKRAAG